MAQMANILVKDDAASPVEYTFVPVTDTPIPYWRTQIAAVPLEGQMRAYFSTEQVKSGDWKVSLKLEVPVMETLGTAGTSAGYVAPQKVAYVNTIFVTAFVNKRSTSQNRSDLLKLGLGIAQGASSTTATGTLDNTSAGSAFNGSVLPGPALFVSLTLPN